MKLPKVCLPTCRGCVSAYQPSSPSLFLSLTPIPNKTINKTKQKKNIDGEKIFNAEDWEGTIRRIWLASM